MSFLDDQATGQIGIGEKASLSTLTRRKRKRKKGQNPTGAETYSLMPQNEFSNIVSSPTDITQVGIGEKLQAQGTDASSVGNVFGDYTSAAPIGTTLEAIYYEPPPDDDDDPGDDDDLPSVEDDPLPDMDPGGVGDFSGYGQPGEFGDPAAKDAYDSFGEMVAGVFDAAKTGIDNTSRSLNTAVSKGLFGEGTGARQDLGRSLGFGVGIGDVNYDIPTGQDGMMPGSTQVGTSSIPSIGDQAAASEAAMESAGQDEAQIAVEGFNDPSVGDPGGPAGPDISDMDPGFWASGGTVTKSKSKNKKSFMSMKGK